MKLTTLTAIIAAILFCLPMQAEDKKPTIPAPSPGLTAPQIATYRAILEELKPATEAYDRAELQMFRAKKAADEANEKASAKFKLLQKEANCEGCGLDPQTLQWIRPVARQAAPEEKK